MVYTDIQGLQGLDRPIDYGSGIQYADGIPLLDLQIGLWLNGTAGCQDIVDGRLDENIRRLSDYLQPKQRVVYLRIGYEFDNPDFGYDNPDLYKKAFTYLQRRMPPYVQACWHSWAASSNYSVLQDYYPGDEYVDMIGVSIFQQVYPNIVGGTMDTLRTVFDFARQCNKSILIAESTPFGGIPNLSDPWTDWFQPVLDLIDEYDVRLWSYIDCDWTRQVQWKYAGFGDTRLNVNATVDDLWKQRVIHGDRFTCSMVDWLSSSSHRTISIVPQYFGGALVVALCVAVYTACCRSSTTHDYAAAVLEDDNDDDWQDVGVEPGRSGYGSLENR